MDRTNPFDDQQQLFHLLLNPQGQYSLWPVFAALPQGWQAVFGPADAAGCNAWLKEHWSNLHPLHQARTNHAAA